MNEQEIIENEFIENEENKTTKLTAIEIWHYIKTFSAFFALVSAGGLILDTFYTNSSVHILFEIMLGVGAVCALVAIKDIFIILHRIAKLFAGFFGALSILMLIPFLPILFTVIFYVGIFGFGLLLCCYFPYVMTLISYFKTIIWEAYDKKKEIIVALSGVLCAVIIFVIIFFAHKTVATVESSSLQKKLDTQKIYTEYVSENPDKKVDNLDFSNPTKSNYDIDNRKQIDIYEFEQNSNGIVYDCKVTIEYTYYNEWELSSIDIKRDFDDTNFNIFGTFKGVYKYAGGIMNINPHDYTVIINNLTKEGGSGTLTIINEQNVCVESHNFTMTFVERNDTEDDIELNFRIVFNEALANGFSTASCKYSLATGELTLVDFYYDEDVALRAD